MPRIASAAAATPSSHHANLPAATSSAPKPPSMLKEMAATAGSVAVGSAVGHVVGHALTGAFGGGSSSTAPVAPGPTVPAAPAVTGGPRQLYSVKDEPCSYEIKQFLSCAVSSGDLTRCQALQEVYRNCMLGHYPRVPASVSVPAGDGAVLADSAPTLTS